MSNPIPNTDQMQVIVDAAAQELATAAAAREETKNVNEIFRSHILAENERLRDENKVIPNLREQNAVLIERAVFAIIGNVLLTVGSLGFGFLGTDYGRNIFEKSGQADLHLICMSVAMFSAIIGLGLNVFQWIRQIFSK